MRPRLSSLACQRHARVILRGAMRKIAEGETYPLPATIDDPAVLAEIDKALATAGYAKR